MTVEKNAKTPLFTDLLARRVPQIFGLYLGCCWGVLQFVQYLVNRYGLSPHLEDLFLLLAISLIPSVLLLVYFHGKPGRDRWTKVELIGVPVNLIAAGFFLLVVFQGKSLGATTQKISVRDEEGNRLEKHVAKREFRKRLVLFPFTNESGQTDLDWLGWGIPLAMNVDLDQDLFLVIANPLEEETIARSIQKARTDLDNPIPVGLCHRLAEENHMPYFLTGSFHLENGKYHLTSTLYETKSALKIAHREVSGHPFFPLIDALTTHLKKDLNIPVVQLEMVQDLPVTEVMTDNLESFKWLVTGIRTFTFEQDIHGAISHLERAVAEDPEHALAYIALGGLQANANQIEPAKLSIQAAADLDFKLTDKSRFQLKDISFILNGQGEKRLALIKMMAELYPESINVHLSLAHLYTRLNQFADAQRTLETVLTMAPQPEIYHPRLAAVHERQGEDSRALAYLQSYSKAFPKDAAGHQRLAHFHLGRGAFEDARTYFEKASLLDKDPLIQLGLADIDIRRGHFDQAHQTLHTLLENTRGPDRQRIFARLETYYTLRGMMGSLGQTVEQKLAEAAQDLIPIELTFRYMNDTGTLIKAGKRERAFELLKQVEESLQGPFSEAHHFGYVIAYLALEEGGKAREHLERVKENQDALAKVFNGVTTFLPYAEGRVLEMEGRLEEAVAAYEQLIQFVTFDAQIHYLNGKCLCKLGRWREARDTLTRGLKLYPAMPELHTELARVYEDMGQRESARNHLSRALKIWRVADPDFKPAQEARLRAEGLSAGTP